MRPIEFRVWDNDEERFLSDEELYWIWWYYYSSCGEFSDEYDWIPTQYIGLKDINGTKIFEWDFISRYFWDSMLEWYIEFDIENCKFIVNMWDNNYIDISSACDDRTVIWNIFESKHLFD